MKIPVISNTIKKLIRVQKQHAVNGEYGQTDLSMIIDDFRSMFLSLLKFKPMLVQLLRFQMMPWVYSNFNDFTDHGRTLSTIFKNSRRTDSSVMQFLLLKAVKNFTRTAFYSLPWVRYSEMRFWRPTLQVYDVLPCLRLTTLRWRPYWTTFTLVFLTCHLKLMSRNRFQISSRLLKISVLIWMHWTDVKWNLKGLLSW